MRKRQVCRSVDYSKVTIFINPKTMRGPFCESADVPDTAYDDGKGAKKYWDMYERDRIPLADNPYRPDNLPKEVTQSGELFSYARVNDLQEEILSKK